MINRSKIQWIAVGTVILILIVSLIFLLLHQFLPEKSHILVSNMKSNIGYVILVVAILIVLVICAVEWLFRFFILPLNKLAEETALIGIVNSRHRLKFEGKGVFLKLVRAINAIAIRFEALQKYDQEKINHIKAEAEKERNILAAIMAELPEGVLICNSEGRILLYNQRAKQFFSGDSDLSALDNSSAPSSKSYIGLGRSIFNIIDKNQVTHALDEIAHKLKHEEESVASYFVSVSTAKELLRVEVVPVLDYQKSFTGFILIFQDITQHLRTADQVGDTLKSLAREIRASSAGIRATIEAILEYPDMNSDQLKSFREIIYKEAITLGVILDKMTIDSDGPKKTEWPLVCMRASDLYEMIKVKAEKKLGIFIQIEVDHHESYIKADAYSLTLAILFLMTCVRKEVGPIRFFGKVEQSGKFVNFDMSWEGRPVKVEMLRKWDACMVTMQGENLPFTLKDVIGQHEGELCAYSSPGIKSKSSLRFFLPAAEDFSADPTRKVAILPKSRPEFFDFNLFGNEGVQLEQANQILTELTYTVFDTETTGLYPDGGDEIISIGAVRIVNGRILREEKFDQFIDPKRSIPKKSIVFHGIQPEMIQGKPDINSVLPRFHRFVSDTILVAHNAAFDMRMLQVKENITGVFFTNPVLDTLLLSAVIHPTQTDHSMEAIANRFGVSIVGRHTAMGDAIATGKLFLKMIPLLADQGIFTLQEAMNASKKTYYARIAY